MKSCGNFRKPPRTCQEKTLADQNEGRYFETAFWKRWCSQGLPDPNNIPLPLAAEYTDYTVETDGYMLNNPNGYKKFPHW